MWGTAPPAQSRYIRCAGQGPAAAHRQQASALQQRGRVLVRQLFQGLQRTEPAQRGRHIGHASITGGASQPRAKLRPCPSPHACRNGLADKPHNEGKAGVSPKGGTVCSAVVMRIAIAGKSPLSAFPCGRKARDS